MIGYDEAVDAKIDAERKRQYDIRTRTDWRLTQQQKNTVAFEGFLLKTAECYIWTPHMIKLMIEARKTMPYDTKLQPSLLKSLAGWWWLGRESRILVRSQADRARMLAVENEEAIANVKSTLMAKYHLDEVDWPGVQERRRLHAVLFGAAQSGQGLYISGFTYDHFEPSGLIVPISSTIWPFGRSLKDQLEYIANEQHKDQGDTKVQARAYSDMKVCELFLVGSLLMNQKLLKAAPANITRGTRRRAERQGYNSSAQIISLRRTEYIKGQTEQQGREWDWHWVVRGHWRDQSFLGEDRLPIWIDPFIKGDLDKPMKPSTERIFVVKE